MEGKPYVNSLWKVQFSMDDETDFNVELSDVRMLHRSPDWDHEQWHELKIEIVSLPLQPIGFQALHLSDIVIAINGANVTVL